MSLWSDFLAHRGRPTHKWTQYFPAYERHLGRFVNQPVTLLEIGIGWGGSLQLWKRYLGPFARIIGVDVSERCGRYAESQIEIRVGDQSDPAFLEQLVLELGPFDVVIDDGSHVMSDIRASFEALYPHTTRVYAVEDLHTAYRDSYGGGLRRDGTFIEVFKSLVDDLHAEHTNGQLPVSAFTESTLSMHIYDSLVVFEKGTHLRNQGITAGSR